jgi:chromosome partitioning protein
VLTWHPACMTVDMAALDRVVALINDKGGVGKTSLVANVGGQAAAAGYRVLVVDLNRQANLADDLGYRDRDGVDDGGLGLLTSLMTATALRAVPGVRENLDVIPGGARLTDLTPLIVSRFAAGGRAAFLALAQALAPIAGDYDLILIDSPPENTTLADLALGAARWVVMPTRSDSGGLVGMKLVAERFQLAREINPNLKLMGVALFASGTGSTAIRAEVRQDVEEAFGGHSPMFEASVRYSERTARDCRKRGLLAHELEVAAAQQPAWWQTLRDGNPASRLSRAVSSVSADYQQMTAEVLQLLAGAELAPAGPGEGGQ